MYMYFHAGKKTRHYLKVTQVITYKVTQIEYILPVLSVSISLSPEILVLLNLKSSKSADWRSSDVMR